MVWSAWGEPSAYEEPAGKRGLEKSAPTDGVGLCSAAREVAILKSGIMTQVHAQVQRCMGQ